MKIFLTQERWGNRNTENCTMMRYGIPVHLMLLAVLIKEVLDEQGI
jgi:hypothetical protein